MAVYPAIACVLLLGICEGCVNLSKDVREMR